MSFLFLCHGVCLSLVRCWARVKLLHVQEVNFSDVPPARVGYNIPHDLYMR